MNNGSETVSPEQIAAFIATVDLKIRKPENTELVEGDDAVRYNRACDYPENSDYGLVVEALKGSSLAGKRILEIGQGPGNLSLELSKEGVHQVIGADPSRVMTNYCKEKFKEEIVNGRMNFVQESVYNLPPEFDSAFDLVVCQNTFHQLYNPLQALEGMVNATKRGGEVHIFDFRRDVTPELLEGRIRYTKREIWRDFANSLCAALTKQEFRDLVTRISCITYSISNASNPSELSHRARKLIELDPVPHHLDYLISQKVELYKKK